MEVILSNTDSTLGRALFALFDNTESKLCSWRVATIPRSHHTVTLTLVDGRVMSVVIHTVTGESDAERDTRLYTAARDLVTYAGVQ